MLRRLVAESEGLLRDVDLMLRKQLAKPRFAAPHSRGLDARRGRRVFPDKLEELTDESVRRPVGEPYLPASAHDTHELGCRLLLVRGEHDTERGQGHVKAAIGKRQRFGVRFLKTDGKALCGGALLSPLEKRGDIIRRRNACKAVGCRQRRIAVAGSNVEHGGSGAHIKSLAQSLADN